MRNVTISILSEKKITQNQFKTINNIKFTLRPWWETCFDFQASLKHFFISECDKAALQDRYLKFEASEKEM